MFSNFLDPLFPKPCGHTRGSSGNSWGRVFDRGDHRGVRCYLRYIHAVGIFEVHFNCDCAGWQFGGLGPALSWTALSLRHPANQANPRAWWSKAGVSWQAFVRNVEPQLKGFNSIVASVALWTWWWSSAHSDFVANAVNRDLWTCGQFSEIGGRTDRKLSFGMIVFGLCISCETPWGRAI